MVSSTSTCSYPLDCERLRRYSTCLPKLCIGYSKRYSSGTAPITLTTSSSCSRLEQTSHRGRQNSTMFLRNSGCQRRRKRIPMAVSSSISDLNSTPRICKSVSLNLKSNEPSTPSMLCCPHPASYLQTSNPPSDSCPIVAKSSLLAVHFSAISSPCFAAMAIVAPTPKPACHWTLETISDGGIDSLYPGRPSR